MTTLNVTWIDVTGSAGSTQITMAPGVSEARQYLAQRAKSAHVEMKRLVDAGLDPMLAWDKPMLAAFVFDADTQTRYDFSVRAGKLSFTGQAMFGTSPRRQSKKN